MDEFKRESWAGLEMGRWIEQSWDSNNLGIWCIQYVEIEVRERDVGSQGGGEWREREREGNDGEKLVWGKEKRDEKIKSLEEWMGKKREKKKMENAKKEEK
jgi:hypothetical protein